MRNFVFLFLIPIFTSSAQAVVRCNPYLYTNPILIVDRTLQENRNIRMIDDEVDVDRLVEIANNAFANDPLYNYIAPDTERRSVYFETLIRHAFVNGRIIADSTRREIPMGFAIWIKSGEAFAGFYDRYLSGQFSYIRTIPVLNFFNFVRWEQFLRRMRRDLVGDQAGYLWMIAVMPDYQDDRLGHNLIAPVLRMASYHSTPIILEAYSKKQVAYFEQLGFKPEATAKPYRNGPEVTFMVWRR